MLMFHTVEVLKSVAIFIEMGGAYKFQTQIPELWFSLNSITFKRIFVRFKLGCSNIILKIFPGFCNTLIAIWRLKSQVLCLPKSKQNKYFSKVSVSGEINFLVAFIFAQGQHIINPCSFCERLWVPLDSITQQISLLFVCLHNIFNNLSEHISKENYHSFSCTLWHCFF